MVLAVLYAVSLAATTAAIAVASCRGGPVAGVAAPSAATIANVAASPAPVLPPARAGPSAARGHVAAPVARDRPDRRAHPRRSRAQHGRRTAGGAVPRARSAPDGRDPSPAPGLAERCRPLLRPAGYYLASRGGLRRCGRWWRRRSTQAALVQALGSIWDGRWYLMIAQHGYPHQLVNEGDGSRWAFFPAFPAAIRAVAEVTRLEPARRGRRSPRSSSGSRPRSPSGSPCARSSARKLADRAVLLFVFFPTAYVLSLAYTEGLFLTAAAACLFALSRRYWITAALCACVAGLTRNTGIVVVLGVRGDGAARGVARAPCVRPSAAAHRPARPGLVHGVQLGDGRHPAGLPDLGAFLARAALRLVRRAGARRALGAHAALRAG